MSAADDPTDADADEELDDDAALEAVGKYRDPAQLYAQVAPGPMPQMGPDGGPVGGGLVGAPPALPPATPELFVCLRGPCRHYWEMVSHMDSGNPADTWGEDGLKDEQGRPLRAPRQHSRTCLVHPGVEVEITENLIYACSRWDPLLPGDDKRLQKRRRVYLKLFPQYASKE